MKQANVYYIITDKGHISWGRGVGGGVGVRLTTCYVSADINNITEGGGGRGLFIMVVQCLIIGRGLRKGG